MGYSASPIKRPRRTKTQVEALRADLYAIAEAARPCSARHIYYLGIGRLWDKDAGRSRRNYSVVVRELGRMRETGAIPWEWITDGTRLVRQDEQFDSVEDALAHAMETYRRNLWTSQSRRVEVWCESDSVAGVLLPITSAWGVGLYSCRGQSSKTYVHEAVVDYLREPKPLTVCFVGDWDPSGRSVPRSVVERMERYGNGQLDLAFRQIAVTADDVRSGQFTSHYVNTADVNFRRYEHECRAEGIDPMGAVEVEALSPGLLRRRLSDAIEALIDDVTAWNQLSRAEQTERELLQNLHARVSEALRHESGDSPTT
ncbi:MULTISPECIES: hypothetical protein [Streptomyces]|uniref:DUF2399 domain-containing protein n=1 Tax=Streptomyces griseiscabiei TaxID=2993540 RepID=A0ABU4LE28_9ACTN|nr:MULTISPECIES: hypothetical protein [Streptomyces]MBZ3908491.1 hypothetical protein [Streptomyces griseiscabiei]MDX2914009.1 hypothetical protein [Streptomyces griseiscabiei]